MQNDKDRQAIASEILANIMHEIGDVGPEDKRFGRLLGEFLMPFTSRQAEQIESIINRRIAIHPKVEEAFQEIDAVFSGDGLEHADFRKRLAYFLERWQKQSVAAKQNAKFAKHGALDLE